MLLERYQKYSFYDPIIFFKFFLQNREKKFVNNTSHSIQQ